MAAAYGIAVRASSGSGRLDGAVVQALAAGGVRMVLARTERGANVAVHDEIHGRRWPRPSAGLSYPP